MTTTSKKIQPQIDPEAFSAAVRDAVARQREEERLAAIVPLKRMACCWRLGGGNSGLGYQIVDPEKGHAVCLTCSNNGYSISPDLVASKRCRVAGGVGSTIIVGLALELVKAARQTGVPNFSLDSVLDESTDEDLLARLFDTAMQNGDQTYNRGRTQSESIIAQEVQAEAVARQKLRGLRQTVAVQERQVIDLQARINASNTEIAQLLTQYGDNL